VEGKARIPMRLGGKKRQGRIFAGWVVLGVGLAEDREPPVRRPPVPNARAKFLTKPFGWVFCHFVY